MLFSLDIRDGETMKKLALATMTTLLLASAAFAQTATGPTRAAASPARVYMPTDAERARWTMADMRTWALAILSYHEDNGKFPPAKNVAELRKYAVPKYLKFAAGKDAWGTPFHYSVSGDGSHFILVSAGADGAFEGRSWRTEGADMKDYAADALVNDSTGMKMFRSWAFE